MPATSDERVGYRLWPKQLEAYQHLGLAPGGERDGQPPVEEMLYGGQAGGGKSHLARAVGVALCSRWAGVRVPLFRRKYTELEDSHIPWIQQEIRPPVAEYTAGRHELKFANGSVLMFRHCDNEQDVYDYLTAEWGGLIIDQAENFSPFMLRFLRHRVRQPVDRYQDWRPVIFLSANPGGLSHDYLREQFVDVRVDEYGTQTFEEGQGTPVEPDTAYVAPRNEGGMRRMYFPAKLADNPSLDKDEYERRLYGLPEHLREAYLNGDWHFVPGAFFGEWQPRTLEGNPWHLWSEDFARRYYGVDDDESFPPTGWETRWTATDGGFADPWCTLWFVRAPDKRTIVWRERYGSRVPIPEQAKTILRLEREDGRFSIERKADPAMFAKRANLTVSDADEYAKVGVRLTRATNLREPGWRRVREALTRKINDYPSTIFIAGRCTNLVRTLPTMMADDKKHEDIADKQEDHACFVAGTLIETGLGPIPIEQIRVGDVVWTRSGLRKVLAAGPTSPTATVVRYRFTGGRELVATPNHPIYTEEQGFIRVDLLRYTHTVRQWEMRDENGYVGSGSLEGLTRFTTKTVTREITPSPILNSLRETSTEQFTERAIALQESWNISPESARWPQWLIALQRVEPDRVEMRARGGSVESQSSIHVSAVGRRTGQKMWGATGSVATTVERSGGARIESITSRQSVPCAVPIFLRTSPVEEPRPALRSVVRLLDFCREGIAPVYNITVEGEHEYFANGILVSNCDTLRYGLMPAAAPEISRRARIIVTMRSAHVDERLGMTGVVSDW